MVVKAFIRIMSHHLPQRKVSSLQVPDEDGTGSEIELINPAGLQLVTQTHFRRAADRRFGEPEDLVAESLEYCR